MKKPSSLSVIATPVVACLSIAAFLMLSLSACGAAAVPLPTATISPRASATFATSVTPAARPAATPTRLTTGGSGGARALVAITADGKTIPPSADAQNLPTGTAVQTVGSLNVTLAVSPFPPTSFQNGNFDVTLTDDKGQPVTDATVSLDLTMPAMRMPANKPKTQAAGNGTYHATAFWTMRGLWYIQVVIQRGDATQSAFFAVTL